MSLQMRSLAKSQEQTTAWHAQYVEERRGRDRVTTHPNPPKKRIPMSRPTSLLVYILQCICDFFFAIQAICTKFCATKGIYDFFAIFFCGFVQFCTISYDSHATAVQNWYAEEVEVMEVVDMEVEDMYFPIFSRLATHIMVAHPPPLYPPPSYPPPYCPPS